MKKIAYKALRLILISLIPFVLCAMLAGIYLTMQPQNYPDPSYPVRTQGALQYLASRWFFIGIILSILFFLIMVVEDVSAYIEKSLERRQLKKRGLL